MYSKLSLLYSTISLLNSIEIILKKRLIGFIIKNWLREKNLNLKNNICNITSLKKLNLENTLSKKIIIFFKKKKMYVIIICIHLWQVTKLVCMQKANIF